MQKNVHPIEIPLCINAIKYFNNESELVYSTLEDDASKILRKFTFCDSTSEVLSVNSENTYYIADTDNYCVYAISVIDKYLYITDFHELKKSLYWKHIRKISLRLIIDMGLFLLRLWKKGTIANKRSVYI